MQDYRKTPKRTECTKPHIYHSGVDFSCRFHTVPLCETINSVSAGAICDTLQSGATPVTSVCEVVSVWKVGILNI
jgi:hypothetical protein